MNHAYQTCIQLANRAEKIVLTSHINPDGDAVGSVLSLYHLFRALGKTVNVILPSEVPENLRWLPGASVIQVFESSHSSVISDADLLVVLDLNDVNRLGALGEALVGSGVDIINVDHHTHPKQFAKAQWIDTDSAATCAMLDTFVTDLISQRGEHLAPLQRQEIATCLYVGIMTDTGSFRFPRTTSEIHRVVARLIEEGADPVMAYENIMNTSSPARTKLLGAALSAMEFFAGNQLCVMQVSKEHFIESGCVVADLDGFVHHTTASRGVQIGVLLVELQDEIKCSLRSKGAKHVRDIAAKYGGGGHVYAAGVRITGMSLSDAKAAVVSDCITELQH